MKRKTRKAKKIKRAAVLILCLLLETVLIVALALYGAGYVVVNGPSETAANLFVHSMMETSALKFVPGLYLEQGEITRILEGGRTDSIPIYVPPKQAEQAEETAPQAAAEELLDEDGDGIILETIKGETYSGYMMTVLDPKRVILACNPDKFGVRGNTVEGYVKDFGAVAGINAGAFLDPSGKGNGSMPMGFVVFEGEIYGSYALEGFVGIDGEGWLRTDLRSGKEIRDAGIQYGVSFGPPLIVNGEMEDEKTLNSGLNPRTAIGQRADGAILLLIIDGRQVYSLGATYKDEAEIMMEYGAVNAMNLDGGSSSMMWYNDGYVNNSASVVGIRNIPTAFIVLPQEEA